MNNFKELKVWQKSIDLAGAVYTITNQFPASEKFNLISQMQRAAVSIASNISEGCGRTSKPVFKNYLEISLGSSYELETQIIISNKLNFLNNADSENLSKQINEVQRMLHGLIGSL